ncbi:hypothetical protein Pla110_13090 [Polystyrenella longa]|uniref:Uncharacterized protein n=1 Tax=Polystyrenella longa TaxID=2528007 RepID=A0A518CK45_9PLAN|nr:hypothetical protein Pla110_13090 [Polystyrenella longa]
MIEQRFDQFHLSGLRTMHLCTQGYSSTIQEQHDLGSLTALGGPNAFPLFFVGANVPSAIPSVQSSSPSCWSFSTSRSQSSRKTPDSVYDLNRLQHIVKEGNDFGKSFQRAPVLSTQRMPSKHSRGGACGRPPPNLGGPLSGKEVFDQKPLLISELRNTVRPGCCCVSFE